MSAMPIAAARLVEPKIKARASRTASMPTYFPLSGWVMGSARYDVRETMSEMPPV
jgi:hypothetical protein